MSRHSDVIFCFRHCGQTDSCGIMLKFVLIITIAVRTKQSLLRLYPGRCCQEHF